MCKVSVVVPVYNGEKYLPECINSLTEQIMEDIEILIVDNNSTDDTPHIAREFCKNDDRVKYIFCAKQGVSHARNMGIAAASGEYIFFVDSDDTLFEDALSTLYDAAEKHGADVTVCNILCYDSDRSFAQDSGKESVLATHTQIPQLFYDKLNTYLLYNVFKLYKTSFLCEYKITFDISLSLGEDLLFNLNVYRNAKNVYYVNRCLYKHHISSDGLNLKYRADMIKIKKMLHEKIKSYLIQNNLFDDSYYAVLLNEVFGLLANELKSQNSDIERVLSLDIVAELTRSGVLKYLTFPKKIAFVSLRLKMKRTLGLFVKYVLK